MIDIIVNLNAFPAKKKMSLTELFDKVGILMSNLSVLKKAKPKQLGPQRLSPFIKF